MLGDCCHEFSTSLLLQQIITLFCWNKDSENLFLFLSASFSLTKMPESYSGETNPLQNGSHCAALFNDRRNGFKPARSENGYLDYGRTTCNGFYDMMANDTRPEKTVGHGRPRCQNQPSRQRSCSEPASSVFGDELCHGMRNLMVGCCSLMLCSQLKALYRHNLTVESVEEKLVIQMKSIDRAVTSCLAHCRHRVILSFENC